MRYEVNAVIREHRSSELIQKFVQRACVVLIPVQLEGRLLIAILALCANKLKCQGRTTHTLRERDILSMMLAAARKQAASREILLWMTPSEAPKALQASECSELLDPMRASCWIFAQH